MIKIENLTKMYRTEEIETFALNNVNLHIKEQEFVAIMGPSGCGKSTLLNVVGLLDKPSKGDYYFNSQLVRSSGEKERTLIRKSNIGFIFQSFNLINELTIFENIELPLVYNKISTPERKKMVNEVMEKMEIAHRAKHYPQQLSGGQQQRAAISRALVIKPKLILADEPTGNLDSKNGLEVINLLKKLNEEGSTILMVTHSEHDSNYASRIIRMKDGEIIAD